MSGYFRPIIGHPGYIAGRQYILLPFGPSNAAPGAVDTIYFLPFILERPLTFTGARMRVVTGGAASSVKAAVWANSIVSNRPLGAPLFTDNTGVATTVSATTVPLVFGAGTLQPGIYWFGSKFTGTLPTMLATASTIPFLSYLGGTTDMANSAMSFANAYANDMPTLAESEVFNFASLATPVLAFQT